MARYDVAYIDESAWPISLQDINVEMTAVQNAIAESGLPAGHQPRWPDVPHDFRDHRLKLGIVSLCAYPSDHILPRYATSNHQIYADRHGYQYRVGRERLDPNRPPAWGKIQLMYQVLEDTSVDWWLWFDCDTYFMNMTVTMDSLLYKYGRARPGPGRSAQVDDARLDPDMHMLVAEDHAMLNTGAFFLRASEWSRALLRKVWGPADSIWIDHPWWENAAILWNFLKDNSQKFRDGETSVDADAKLGDGAVPDDMQDIYPAEVRLAPQAEFNSYHPATSHFLHDTWEPGKFAIAFNGVLSNTSPTVIRVLYGNYYELACRLNEVQDQCVKVEKPLPWLGET
uniref:Galactosyl transferase GMA12/MNN10 family protein n=1 Tax=Pyrodinium bahamense TaxID=73915 RepID=A0A7S0AMV8_9DINO